MQPLRSHALSLGLQGQLRGHVTSIGKGDICQAKALVVLYFRDHNRFLKMNAKSIERCFCRSRALLERFRRVCKIKVLT